MSRLCALSSKTSSHAMKDILGGVNEVIEIPQKYTKEILEASIEYAKLMLIK
jgi:hypothetical protein